MYNEHFDFFILETRESSAEDNACDDMVTTRGMKGKTYVLWKISTHVSLWLLQIPYKNALALTRASK
jgi:hypothetical protein